MTPTTSRRPGRPEGPQDGRARQAILDAATRQFALHGFERASLRAIAHEAGVDPALITHYLGSKQDLFVAAVALPIDPGAVVRSVMDGDRAGVGRRLASAVVEVLESREGRAPLLGMVRAAASQAHAGEVLRERLSAEVLEPIAAAVGGRDPRLRASLAMSQVVGLVMARYVVKIEPLASASAPVLVAALAPTLQRYLVDDLGTPRVERPDR